MDGLGPIDGGPEGEAGSDSGYVEGQLLVQFENGVTNAMRDQILAQEGATLLQSFYGLNAAWIELSGQGTMGVATTNIDEAADQWMSKPEVSFASPNRIHQYDATFPDDQLFPVQWALHNLGLTGGLPDADVDAPEAWDTFTGSKSVVVAVMDSGVDYLHVDLDDNMWHNPGEIPGDGIDNDNNGYVDDIYGISPGSGPTDVDPMDVLGHGTHVSGLIGAEGNNGIGVTGVNWDVQIMAIRVGDAAGPTDAGVLAGITYATMMREQYGINVVSSNHSYGLGPIGNPLHEAAIQAHIDSGIVFVTSAGNDDENIDFLPSYPASYDLDGIITVAATGPTDVRASYSNFGQISVDLAAPGGDGAEGDPESMWSTWPPGLDPFTPYNAISGTSMASPMVAGAVALVRGLAPELSPIEAKDIILSTVDPLPSLRGITVTGGRLNIDKAIDALTSSSVEGVVWRDDNGNAVQDAGEVGIPNWTVFIDLDQSGTLDPGEPFDVTDLAGDYVISSFVAPGTYTVAQVLPPNWTQTYPTGGTHTINFAARGDSITDIDFGNKPLPGSVSGVKWHDMDGNGVHDVGEPGMAGIYIFADLNNDGRIAIGEPAAITAADGSYQIVGIPGGEVRIREALTPGWEITYPVLGYHLVDVIPAENVGDIDFGNASSADFGDAPAPYPTLAAAGGAFARYPGRLPTWGLAGRRTDGLPSPTAVGDDRITWPTKTGSTLQAPYMRVQLLRSK